MGVEGIGARATRKEDKRFITGRGRYTDDMKRAWHALRGVRPLAACAREDQRASTSSAAKAMPGVVGVLTGAELAADGIGNLICGWMIKSKDGNPMKMGAFPALAKETVRFVGQAVRGGRRRDRGCRRAMPPTPSSSIGRSFPQSSI